MTEVSQTAIVDKLPEALKALLTTEARAMRQRLGPFNPEPAPEADGVERVDIEHKILRSGALYSGEMTTSGEISGLGFMIWPSGSIYEGYWKNNMANGRGRFISANGDVYEGLFFNAKIHGYGEYTGRDGAKYCGEWRDG